MKTRHSGFTLVELLVTMLIAGIVLAMAVPAYTRFVASARVTDQVNDLVGAITLARSEAIRRNATVILCRAADAADDTCETGSAQWTFWIMILEDANRTQTGSVVLRRGTLANAVKASAINLTDDRIRFTPDGLASNNGGLLNNTHQFRVCSTRFSTNNITTLTLGASSRIFNARSSGTCT